MNLVPYTTSDGKKGYFIPEEVLKCELDTNVGTVKGLLFQLLTTEDLDLDAPIYLQQVDSFEEKQKSGFECITDDEDWNYIRPVGWLTKWKDGKIGINVDY